jgi:hypothetical protein
VQPGPPTVPFVSCVVSKAEKPTAVAEARGGVRRW